MVVHRRNAQIGMGLRIIAIAVNRPFLRSLASRGKQLSVASLRPIEQTVVEVRRVDATRGRRAVVAGAIGRAAGHHAHAAGTVDLHPDAARRVALPTSAFSPFQTPDSSTTTAPKNACRVSSALAVVGLLVKLTVRLSSVGSTAMVESAVLKVTTRLPGLSKGTPFRRLPVKTARPSLKLHLYSQPTQFEHS